jgi:hypothetical protein
VVPGLAAGKILVRSGRAGDANLDGGVGFADLVVLAQNYNVPPAGATWTRGDFNYDGVVNFGDLVILAQNYGASGSAPVAGVPVAALAPMVQMTSPVAAPAVVSNGAKPQAAKAAVHAAPPKPVRREQLVTSRPLTSPTFSTVPISTAVRSLQRRQRSDLLD